MFQLTSKRDAVQFNSPSFLVGSSIGSIGRIIATSARIAEKKRNYGDDYQPFSKSYGVRNVTFQAAKAGIISASLLVNECNLLLEKDTNEKIDFNPLIVKYATNFLYGAIRNLSVSMLQHFYEYMATVKLSAKTADRLCKNLLKSAARKIARYSRIEACLRMSKTVFWTEIPYYCSVLTVDIVFGATDYFYYSRPKQTSRLIVMWLGRRIVFYSGCKIASAGGYALGCYFTPSTGSVVSCVFVSLYSTWANSLL